MRLRSQTSSGKTALSLDVCEAASEDALPVLVGGTGVYVQSALDGWDLTGTGTLRRSLERDFPRTRDGNGHGSANLARRGSTIDQR